MAGGKGDSSASQTCPPVFAALHSARLGNEPKESKYAPPLYKLPEQWQLPRTRGAHVLLVVTHADVPVQADQVLHEVQDTGPVGLGQEAVRVCVRTSERD